MSLCSTFLATCLLGLSFLIAPASTAGQTPTADSAANPASAVNDSQPALADTVPDTGSAGTTLDSVRQPVQPDNASGVDSTKVASDSTKVSSDNVGREPAASATKSDTGAVSSAPRDSILDVACSGPAGPAAVARDLLVVVFTPESGAQERAAVAKSVEGKLLGPVSSGEPGAYYLRVPSGGEEYRLRVAADELIQLAQVKQVGSRACPPLPAAGKTRPSGLSSTQERS